MIHYVLMHFTKHNFFIKSNIKSLQICFANCNVNLLFLNLFKCISAKDVFNRGISNFQHFLLYFHAYRQQIGKLSQWKFPGEIFFYAVSIATHNADARSGQVVTQR